MKVTDLQYSECILCTTVEEALAIEKLMHEAGLVWCNGKTYIDVSESEQYIGEHTYYPKEGRHGPLYYSKNNNDTIHNAQLFLDYQPNYEIY